MEVAGYIGHPNSGIVLYKNVWPSDANYIERLEAILSDSTHQMYSWKQAMVGHSEVMKDYRDCFDFKIRENHLPIKEESYEDLGAVYSEIIKGVRECVAHYSSLYQLSLEYEEATNFVKYGEGQHFSVHPDSGFSYSCTVSTIGYINDDYEGGEYMMPYQNIKFIPEKGDVIVHPSDFIYAHASLSVTKGTKYSAVTMYDYNDRNHQEGKPSSYGATQTISSSALGSVNSQVTSIS